ncbi:MAG: penicillin-binding protein 1C [Nitrospirota bacterium]|nr:penicillin-binding protein 1C [Nitrospirota bacterium]
MKNRKHIVRFAAITLITLVLFRLLSPSLKSDVSFSQAIYDRNGKLLRLTLSRDDKYRLWLPLTSISPVLARTTLLHEDKWFRFHPGVSPSSLVRAIWHTYVKRDRKIGGSTITMQLARIKYDINSRTISGKTTQILAALWLELLYSKNEILEAYLNFAPYGLNIEGAGAASLVYFHKNADKLTLADAITLSVIPQSPARRMVRLGDNGISPRPDLDQARKVLFAKWAAKYPKDEDQKALVNQPVSLKRPGDLPFRAPHFVNEVRELDPFDPVINTTVDLKLQTLFERHVRSYVEANKQRGIRNAVAMLVDARTLEVRALVGSANFFDQSIDGQVNGARAKRSPGSALKPFIYGMGLDQGIIHPLTMLKDAPMSFGAYNPENFDNEFLGPVKARDALVKSRNVPAVEIASKLASPGLHGFLLKAGITRMKDEAFYGMSLALGSAEVTMEELVQLYAMLVNDGTLKPLKFHTGQNDGETMSLLSKEAAFLVLDMLAANPAPDHGYRSDWVRNAFPVSWKTGTSFGFRDAWSIGIAGPYVIAVWIGNFDGEGNPVFVGRDAAAPLFFEIIDSLKSQDPEMRKSRSSNLAELNLTKVEVCALSGGLPGTDCDHRVGTWFIPGKSPISKCDVHRRIFVNSRTGLRSCADNAPGTKPAVYEFWPSDLHAIFRQAGIPRKIPPPYEPGCKIEDTAARGAGPRITSPREGLVYSLRLEKIAEERLPLSAVTDADTRKIHWFANETYLGESMSGKMLFWTPRTGKVSLRAVDDLGRSSVREVVIKAVE